MKRDKTEPGALLVELEDGVTLRDIVIGRELEEVCTLHTSPRRNKLFHTLPIVCYKHARRAD